MYIYFNSIYNIVTRNKEKRKEYMRVYLIKYRAEHISEKKATNNAYRKANRDKILAQMRAYYVAHKDKMNEDMAKYYVNNKARIAEGVAEYKRTPQGKAAVSRSWNKRRYAEKITACDLTLEQWTIIIEEQGNRCKHCGKTFFIDVRATRDHIIPISKGGGLTYGNVQALCQSCNSRKNNRCEEDLPYLKGGK